MANRWAIPFFVPNLEHLSHASHTSNSETQAHSQDWTQKKKPISHKAGSFSPVRIFFSSPTAPHSIFITHHLKYPNSLLEEKKKDEETKLTEPNEEKKRSKVAFGLWPWDSIYSFTYRNAIENRVIETENI